MHASWSLRMAIAETGARSVGHAVAPVAQYDDDPRGSHLYVEDEVFASRVQARTRDMPAVSFRHVFVRAVSPRPYWM